MISQWRSSLCCMALLSAVIGCGQTPASQTLGNGDEAASADVSGDESTQTDVTDTDNTNDTATESGDVADTSSDNTSTDVGDEQDDEVDGTEDSTSETPVTDTMEAGTYSVSTAEESYTTPDGTGVSVKVYMPEETGSYPVVIFGHGFMLSPDLYDSYGNHLASWGYVVLMPEYPGSMFSPTNHRTLKEYGIGLIDWLEGEPGSLSGKILVGKIAMTGHSLGGKVAIMVATEDSRVKAVFGLDAVDAAGGGPMSSGPTPENPSVTPELMNQITVPFVSLGETVSGTGGGMFSSACAPEEDNFQQYYIHAEGPALQIDVLGASHMSFLDDPNCGITCSVCAEGSDDPAVSRAITQRYMTAFFEMTLKDNRGYMTYLTGSAMAGDVADGYVTFESKNGFGN